MIVQRVNSSINFKIVLKLQNVTKQQWILAGIQSLEDITALCSNKTRVHLPNSLPVPGFPFPILISKQIIPRPILNLSATDRCGRFCTQYIYFFIFRCQTHPTFHLTGRHRMNGAEGRRPFATSPINNRPPDMHLFLGPKHSIPESHPGVKVPRLLSAARRKIFC